jgi:transcriptional regulator GlxA family with amidase domain
MKFFKKATGMTFVKYLTHLRVAHAHRLLTTTDLPISEIAVSAGFCDQSYFDRRFRQHYGETPRKVRERTGLSK